MARLKELLDEGHAIDERQDGATPTNPNPNPIPNPNPNPNPDPEPNQALMSNVMIAEYYKHTAYYKHTEP